MPVLIDDRTVITHLSCPNLIGLPVGLTDPRPFRQLSTYASDCCVSRAVLELWLVSVNVPYLHARLPSTLKWRVLGALMKITQRPSAYTESTHGAILGALGAMNLAAAHGVREGREALVANLLAEMVSEIEAIASVHL